MVSLILIMTTQQGLEIIARLVKDTNVIRSSQHEFNNLITLINFCVEINSLRDERRAVNIPSKALLTLRLPFLRGCTGAALIQNYFSFHTEDI